MHLAKGEREDKKTGPKYKPKAHKPNGGSQGGKGTNYVQEPPQVARNIPKKEREGKLESIVSLEEPSPMMTVCLKIEATWSFSKKLSTQFASRKLIVPPKEGHQCP